MSTPFEKTQDTKKVTKIALGVVALFAIAFLVYLLVKKKDDKEGRKKQETAEAERAEAERAEAERAEAERVEELTTPIQNMHNLNESHLLIEPDITGPECWSMCKDNERCNWAIHFDNEDQDSRGCWLYSTKEEPETELHKSWKTRALSKEGCKLISKTK